MNKIAIQNKVETEELLADDATAHSSGSCGVTAAYLHFILVTNWYLLPSSLIWRMTSCICQRLWFSVLVA